MGVIMSGVNKRYRSFVKVDRPVGLKLPQRMRCICKVTKLSDELVVFQRRQVNTLYTNPHIYSSRAYDIGNHLGWLESILSKLRPSGSYAWYPDYPDMEEYDA